MNPWFSKIKPIVWQGWAVYVAAAAVFIYQLIAINKISSSTSETLFGVFPQAAVIFLMVALIVRSRNQDHHDH